MHYFKKTRKTEFGYILSINDFAKLSSNQQTEFMFDFICQSNYIEGISRTWHQAVPIEQKSSLPKTYTSHRNAFDCMTHDAFIGIPPISRRIKHLHKTLMDGLLPEEELGCLRKINVGTLDGENKIKPYPTPESLPYLMEHYENSLKNFSENPTVTQEDLLENHAYFEWIHPFVDGNGRTGRLLLNWLSLQYRNEFYVIESGRRQEYFQFLQSLEEKFNKKHSIISKRK